ncbi:MAG TPA: GGDEF domain-containing protein [Myxococcota bacterium]|nr:GGDEF domain-containing protein [Myxococcota bacterium]HQK52108.1 GGDEF domain-containing protein [Myxococcota bacterium]
MDVDGKRDAADSLWTPPTGATRPVDTVALKDLLADRAILIEMSGPDAGRVHSLVDREYRIGRSARCEFCFPDATLSREHARLTRTDEGWVLEDLRSTNGTFVQQDRVTRHLLRHGDFIRLGSGVRMQFQQVSGEEEAVMRRLYEASVRDGLTGVFNRRYLQERIAAEVSYAVRHGTELVVLLLDLDHFKRINDTHGHLAGDEVLRQVASLVGNQLRREDTFARYGGEEFAVLLRETPPRAALVVAQRIRTGVESLEIPFEGTPLHVTLSIGVAILTACPGRPTPEDLLARADEALYHAKESGRNRVAVAGEQDRPPEVFGPE